MKECEYCKSYTDITNMKNGIFTVECEDCYRRNKANNGKNIIKKCEICKSPAIGVMYSNLMRMFLAVCNECLKIKNWKFIDVSKDIIKMIKAG